ncbi:hypothetical protein FQA39_LY18744 [Lamprigera yunnana]|nr:hypothetical protein FQA39_LY18744 [Lamprigera yunnana]
MVKMAGQAQRLVEHMGLIASNGGTATEHRPHAIASATQKGGRLYLVRDASTAPPKSQTPWASPGKTDDAAGQLSATKDGPRNSTTFEYDASRAAKPSKPMPQDLLPAGKRPGGQPQSIHRRRGNTPPRYTHQTNAPAPPANGATTRFAYDANRVLLAKPPAGHTYQFATTRWCAQNSPNRPLGSHRLHLERPKPAAVATDANATPPSTATTRRAPRKPPHCQAAPANSMATTAKVAAWPAARL